MPQRREKRLLTPPAGDLCMVPREEDVRHGLALEITRARVLRIAEQPIEEGVRRGGRGITFQIDSTISSNRAVMAITEDS